MAASPADFVVLGFVGRGGQTLLSFLPEGEPERRKAAESLACALAAEAGGRRSVVLTKIDGASPNRATLLVEALVEQGFELTSRGLVCRPRREGRDARG